MARTVARMSGMRAGLMVTTSMAAVMCVAALAACSGGSVTGRGGLGAVSGAPSVAGGPTLLPSPDGSSTPGKVPGAHPSHSPSANPSSAPPSGPPSAPPTRVRNTNLHVRGDYSVVDDHATGCSWRVVNGTVQIIFAFAFRHTGILPSGDVPWVASDDTAGDSESGTVAAFFINAAQYPIDLGSPGHDSYAGKSVTVSVTIHPTGVDNSSANNTATNTLDVPADAVAASPTDNQGQHFFSC